MASIAETAEKKFRSDFAKYKALTGYKNKEIAEMLGCSDQTISNLYNRPLASKSEYVLIIQERLRREEMKLN